MRSNFEETETAIRGNSAHLAWQAGAPAPRSSLWAGDLGRSGSSMAPTPLELRNEAGRERARNGLFERKVEAFTATRREYTEVAR